MADTQTPALLDSIRDKRRQLETFIAAAGPRKRRLLNTSIVGGACAAALTAGPAMGGQTFTAWLTGTLGLTAPSWQLLCGLAAVCSLAATVSTQLLKSHRLEERVARAVGCRAKLEALEAGLTSGQIDSARAAVEYVQCVQDAAYVEV